MYRRNESPIPGEEKVLSFIESIDLELKKERDMNSFKHSDVYKRNMANRECERGKDECMKYLMKRCMKDATPLSDEYKAGHDEKFGQMVDKHCPDGPLFYFHELGKKGNCGERCIKVLEAVDKVMEQKFCDKKCKPQNYSPEDMTFQMDAETKSNMDELYQDLALDDISNLIADNVRRRTEEEVRSAREARENDKNLEKELGADLTIRTEAAIDRALELKGQRESKFYQPSVFNGIMIGNMNRANNEGVLTESYTYHALDDYGMVTEENSPSYNAMVESVQEYTWYVLENTLFQKRHVDNRTANRIANKYAAGLM